MLARSALEKYGVSDKDVKLAAVGGDRDRYQALIGGVVDAAVVSNEYQPIAPKNIHLLVAGRDAVPNFLRVCMISTAKKLAERGDDAVKFLAAEMNALRFALSQQGRDRRADARAHQRQARRSAPGFRVMTTRSSTRRSIRRCRCRPRRSNGSRSRW